MIFFFPFVRCTEENGGFNLRLTDILLLALRFRGFEYQSNICDYLDGECCF